MSPIQNGYSFINYCNSPTYPFLSSSSANLGTRAIQTQSPVQSSTTSDEETPTEREIPYHKQCKDLDFECEKYFGPGMPAYPIPLQDNTKTAGSASDPSCLPMPSCFKYTPLFVQQPVLPLLYVTSPDGTQRLIMDDEVYKEARRSERHVAQVQKWVRSGLLSPLDARRRIKPARRARFRAWLSRNGRLLRAEAKFYRVKIKESKKRQLRCLVRIRRRVCERFWDKEGKRKRAEAREMERVRREVEDLFRLDEEFLRSEAGNQD